jgi:hypothetical protein
MKINKTYAINICKEIISSNGVCNHISCTHCPGNKYNHISGKNCWVNGWSGILDWKYSKFFQDNNFNSEEEYRNQCALNSAKEWLLKYDHKDNIYREE